MIVRKLSACFVLAATLGLYGCGSSGPADATQAPSSPLDNAIAATAAELQGEAKMKYEAALSAEPFANQQKLITGKFHGQFKDDDLESFYEYERKPDGTVTHVTVDMYQADKEYLRDEITFPWTSKGRVIYEGDDSDAGKVYILLLDEVTEEKIKYQMIDPEMGLTEDAESEDLRGPGDLPDVPEGWTEVEE